MKRYCIILIAALVCAGAATAQEDNNKQQRKALHAVDTTVVRGENGKGWVRSHFFDEWFAAIQGGGLLYYGADDRKGAFGDRLTGDCELVIGRRIFPMFGFNIRLGYGAAHGFITRDHYNTYRSEILDHGGFGQCGNDAAGNPYGGYYWDYNANLLIQKWKYTYVGFDIFMDFALLLGSSEYDPYRKYNHVIYGGLFERFGLSETNSSNNRAEAHIGYIFKYNLSPRLSIYADLRGSFVEREFDREWVPYVETPSMGVDFILNAQVGFLYNFNIRREEKRNDFKEMNETTLDHHDAQVQVSYVQVEEKIVISKIDTLIKHLQMSVPTPETLDLIDSLRNEIDAEMAERMRLLGEEATLASILSSHVLPYEQIFFDIDKSVINPTEKMKIEKMAYIMMAYPRYKFMITGSADAQTGTRERNEYLSYSRAIEVFNILVNQYGIDPDRLECEFLGGIDDYEPYQLNRCAVIIMKHPAVKREFDKLKKK